MVTRSRGWKGPSRAEGRGARKGDSPGAVTATWRGGVSRSVMRAEPGRGQEPGVREADPGAVTTAWRSVVSRPAGPAREYQAIDAPYGAKSKQ